MRLSMLPIVTRANDARELLLRQIRVLEGEMRSADRDAMPLVLTIGGVRQDEAMLELLRPVVLPALRAQLDQIDADLAAYGVIVGHCEKAPPLRLSTDDPDYASHKRAGIDVWLDGIRQADCVAYDCEAGWVKRNVRNADGKLEIDPVRNQPYFQLSYGQVTVAYIRPGV